VEWEGQSTASPGDQLLLPDTPDAKEMVMTSHLVQLWSNDDGQDIAEYAVMLAVILVIVVGTIRLIGSNANTVFSQVASSVQ
jgi:Flp pilus assembly pilin Flp